MPDKPDSAHGAPPSQPFIVSNELLGEPTLLRARLQQYGYLFLRGILDTTALASVRKQIQERLTGLGWLDASGERVPAKNFSIYPGDPAYWAGLQAMLELPDLYALKSDPGLAGALSQIFDMKWFAHPRTVPRIAFPATTQGRYESPAHQDYPYGQGGLDTVTAWITLGDCTRTDGSLEIMAGSHRKGLRTIYGGTEYRCAATRVSVTNPAWHGGDVMAGDALLFTSLTVHRARPNIGNRVRLSIDVRFQPEDSPLCQSALEPAFRPRIPDWPHLLAPEIAAAVTAVPQHVHQVPAVRPEDALAPMTCQAFPWLVPASPSP
ncbi:MAG TPA: phytanoyl-CoA dioxygenase family protein [Candidatus Limnocylindrales bacterium]|nr:phytanoyl-CoA dioxygenase family protein [Candidatus Limnocylindrales bacterium]